MADAPTADEIRAAAVAAAAATGEAPDFLLTGFTESRARLVALAAILAVWPKVDATEVATGLCFLDPSRARMLLARSRKATWWDDMWIDDVVGALVSDRYGVQAE